MYEYEFNKIEQVDETKIIMTIHIMMMIMIMIMTIIGHEVSEVESFKY